MTQMKATGRTQHAPTGKTVTIKENKLNPYQSFQGLLFPTTVHGIIMKVAVLAKAEVNHSTPATIKIFVQELLN